jgi:hypothetical protein
VHRVYAFFALELPGRCLTPARYNESVTRRFLYKATGQKEKFAVKADKEEKEYFEALRSEHQAQDEREKLSRQMAEAQAGKVQLEPDASTHQGAQKDLDALYQSVFAGDTPGFPEEDTQEGVVQGVQERYQQLESTLKAEEQTLALLTQAAKVMAIAQNQVQEALSYSTGDIFGGGAVWDYLERSALGRAEMATHECYRLTQQAQALSSLVTPLPQISIAQGSIITDVFFDNIFTDLAFHQKIQASAVDLQRAAAVLRHNVQASQQRSADSKTQMTQVSEWLAEERKQLQKIRGEIFSRLAQPPPAYEGEAPSELAFQGGR